jgi:K+-sensing histidine kinase KdpD
MEVREGTVQRQRLSSFLAGYLVALLGVALAMGITFAILQTSGFRTAIGYAYLFAILIAAWLGYGPGLLSYALSFFVAPYFFVPKF